jgi:hypothetical protein
VAIYEDEEMEQLRAQEASRVRDEAKKCLQHASFQLGKAAYGHFSFFKNTVSYLPLDRLHKI